MGNLTYSERIPYKYLFNHEYHRIRIDFERDKHKEDIKFIEKISGYKQDSLDFNKFNELMCIFRNLKNPSECEMDFYILFTKLFNFKELHSRIDVEY